VGVEAKEEVEVGVEAEAEAEVWVRQNLFQNKSETQKVVGCKADLRISLGTGM